MRGYYLILFISAVLTGCSQKAEPVSDADSVQYDTAEFLDETDSLFLSTSDAPGIVMAVQELMREHEQNNSAYYKLHLSATGHEYKTDEVWAFDSLMNLVHCYQDWSSEGTEGKTHYIFQQEKLFAIEDRNLYDGGTDINVYHRELGGMSFSEKGNGRIDSTASPLEKRYFSDSERDLRSRLAEIVKLLKTNEKSISGSDPAQLKIEDESEDEEMPGKETTEIKIDKKLLTGLLH